MSFSFNAAEAVNSEVTPSTPDTSAPTQTPEQTAAEAKPNQSPEQAILDLASVEKFKYQDRVWTPKELQSAILMQSDYTKKTQELAQERKYAAAVPHDLASLAQNPKLIDEFKQIYPKQYWATAEALVAKIQGSNQLAQPSTVQSTQTTEQLPEYARQAIDRLTKLEEKYQNNFDPLVSDFQERKEKAINAELDAVYSKYQAKYPYAREAEVTNVAMELNKRNVDLTDAVWEKIYALSQKDAIDLSDRIYADKVKKQKTNSDKAFAGSPGGATPGAAPKNPKTIKEATQLMLESGEL